MTENEPEKPTIQAEYGKLTHYLNPVEMADLKEAVPDRVAEPALDDYYAWEEMSLDETRELIEELIAADRGDMAATVFQSTVIWLADQHDVEIDFLCDLEARFTGDHE